MNRSTGLFEEPQGDVGVERGDARQQRQDSGAHRRRRGAAGAQLGRRQQRRKRRHRLVHHDLARSIPERKILSMK